MSGDRRSGGEYPSALEASGPDASGPETSGHELAGRDRAADPGQAGLGQAGEGLPGEGRRRRGRGGQGRSGQGWGAQGWGAQGKGGRDGHGPAGPALPGPAVSGLASSGLASSGPASSGHAVTGHDRQAAARIERGPAHPLYAALDLGTNNCRLLIARPEERGFKVVDAYSRIVRLGEGVGASRRLSDAAMERAIEALDSCQRKLAERGVLRARLIATEACRAADNGPDFIERVRRETGLALEIVNRETEARLAVAGCASLVDRDAEGVLLFDIGGGSSEIVWLDLRNRGSARGYALTRFIRAWTSLPVGVVNLAERHGGMHVSPEIFEAMVGDVAAHLDSFAVGTALGEAIAAGRVHMLGTSGTVTTLAGVHFGLRRYDRRRVDGAWLADEDVSAMIEKLRGMSYDERVGNPCIGADRADLVLAGCAILEAIRRRWSCSRLRVADRGLREGILTELMSADGVWSRGSRPHRGQKGKT
uniref:Ppx/GppA phosphatase family protein n=1 Tax=Pannonibacter tanglangensis TaxID=2750084 RepID=UPI00374249D5